MSGGPIPVEPDDSAFRRRVLSKAAALRSAWQRRDALSDAPPWAIVTFAAIAAVLIAAFALDRASIGWAAGLGSGLRDAGEFLSAVGRSHWYLVPTGVVLLLLASGDWTRLPASLGHAWGVIAALCGVVFLAVGLGAIIANILKIIFGRARPFLVDDVGWLAFDPWSVGYDFASFPSGHATTAGALIVAGWFILPRLRLPVLLFGLAIAVSRIIVGAHYPSDVIAGLFTGAIVAYGLVRVFARHGLGFSADPIRPATGPIRSAIRDHGLGAFLVAPLRAL